MRRSKTSLLVALAVLVALGSIFGFRAVRTGTWRRSAKATYSTAQVSRGSLEVTVTGTGTLVPVARQTCVTTAGGEVESVLVKPGQAVKKGETLLVLRNDTLADEVEQARLQLGLAQIDLDAMTKPGAGLATTADVSAAQAAVENARLAAEQARDNVDGLTVTAPFSGTVSGIAVQAGDEVAPGTPLLTVFTPDRLRAVLSVPEDDLGHLAVGDPLTVTVGPLGRDLAGHLSAIASQGTPNARGVISYQVTVTLDDSDPGARGGMSVSARVPTGNVWPFDETTVYGTLSYEKSQPLAAATPGTVLSVEVTEGQRVVQGQTLLTLDSDQARAALASAEADLARAEQKLAQLTSPGPSSYPQTQLDKQKLVVAQASMKLASLERQLAELTVKAAFDGVVTDVAVMAGEQAPPNTVLAVVADLDEVQAVITVDELEVANLAVGQAATVRIDALPGETFAGTVDSLSLEGVQRDGVTGYEARITLPGDPRMRAGMSVSASVLVARRDDTLLVPVEAVYGAGKEASVQVLVDGRPQAVSVVAGLSNSTFTEILEGLVEGQTVVTGTLEVNDNPFQASEHPGSSAGSAGGGGD